MKKISQSGIDLIKSFEGCRLTAYKPVPTESYYTIGYGHYGADVAPDMKITQQQADDMLATDLQKYEAYVNNPYYCPVTGLLNQNQFDALVSFCYNLGAGGLRALCYGRSLEQIAEHIPDFNRGGGNVLPGLVRRRQAEVDLFRTEVKYIMNKADGKQIKLIMEKYYYEMEGNKEVQDFVRYLGKELRKACGMKEDEEFE